MDTLVDVFGLVVIFYELFLGAMLWLFCSIL